MGGIVQKIEQKKDYIGPDLCYVAGMPSGAAAATGKLPLTPRQREHLLQALRQATEARLYRRLLALVQIDRGKPVAQVAEELMVSRMTVHRWLRRYLRCRDPWGLVERAGRGRPRLWTPQLESLLEQALRASPTELGYRGARWTLPLLQAHLLQQGGPRLSVWTLRRQLQRLGLVDQRPRLQLPTDPAR